MQKTFSQHTVKNLNDICQRVRNNPSAHHRVSEWVREMCYSTDHFIQVFTKHMKMTPGTFIQKCRIENADALLRMSSYSISQIALLCGYNDVYSFSRRFKYYTGLSPSHYRSGVSM